MTAARPLGDPISEITLLGIAVTTALRMLDGMVLGLSL
jgi:hypothetical protein